MLDAFDFSSINYIAVLVATLLAFGLGALWYGPPLFGKTWQAEMGLSDADLQSGNMGLTYGLTFVAAFIAMLFLAALIKPDEGVNVGAMYGVVVGVAFVAMSIGTHYLFSQKSLKIFLIDAGYDVVRYALAGAVLGAW